MSTTSTTTVPTCLGPSAPGTPLYPPQLSAIMNAAASGAGTQTYYQDQVVLDNFTIWLAQQGDAAWVADTDDNGNPCYFAVQVGGEDNEMVAPSKPVTSYRELMELDESNSIYLILQTNPDTDVINGSQPAPGFTWNGTTYQMAGTITGTFSYNQQPTWYIEVPVGIADTVGIGILSKVLWSQFISPLITSFWTGVKKALSSGSEATDLEGVESATGDAVDAAATTGADVGEGVAVDVVTGATAFCGIAILVAIPIILDIIAHPSYHTLTVYNLTPYDLDWTIGYQNEGVMNAAPVMGDGSTTLNPLIPAQANVAPPNLQPVDMSFEGNFSFASTSQYEGLGYVMSYTLTDPTTKEVVATAAGMWDIPFAGQNSLFATFDPGTDFQSIYDDNQNVNEVTQMAVSQAAAGSASAIDLSVTFDYLSGKHPTPSGQESYTYNSMAVFSIPSSS
jgi:hypothetical protein